MRKPGSGKDRAALRPERSPDTGCGNKGLSLFPRSPFPHCLPSLAYTDGNLGWGPEWSRGKSSPSLRERSSDAGERAGTCARGIHTIYCSRLAGARGCEREASGSPRWLRAWERGWGWGEHVPGKAGLALPGSPHLLQGAPLPPPVRSRCRRFLNQLLTCVSERPVSVARRRFSSGVG